MADDGINTVERALDAFSATLTPGLPGDMAGFVAGRVELMRTVNQFFVLTGIVGGARPAAVATPDGTDPRDDLNDAFVILRRAYSAHVAKWNNRSVAASWSTYRDDSIALVGCMRRLLRRHERGRTRLVA